ncbi:MAG: hypothetical protein V9G04_05995 [Nocardioides sp.]|jgi:hypothetical protein
MFGFNAGAVAAPVIGAGLAFLAMFGLVSSQTAPPDKNPAAERPLVYGD